MACVSAPRQIKRISRSMHSCGDNFIETGRALRVVSSTGHFATEVLQFAAFAPTARIAQPDRAAYLRRPLGAVLLRRLPSLQRCSIQTVVRFGFGLQSSLQIWYECRPPSPSRPVPRLLHGTRVNDGLVPQQRQQQQQQHTARSQQLLRLRGAATDGTERWRLCRCACSAPHIVSQSCARLLSSTRTQ